MLDFTVTAHLSFLEKNFNLNKLLFGQEEYDMCFRSLKIINRKIYNILLSLSI